MSWSIILLVLGAALLHATWNIIVKGGQNKLFETAMNALGGGLGAMLILPYVISVCKPLSPSPVAFCQLLSQDSCS